MATAHWGALPEKRRRAVRQFRCPTARRSTPRIRDENDGGSHLLASAAAGATTSTTPTACHANAFLDLDTHTRAAGR
eukprot:2534990-Heterocapsa_arctica.AAC.1